MFVAIGGSAYAATKIGTKQLKNNAVTAAKIKNSAVTSAKIKNNAVTAAKIKSGAIAAGKLADGSVVEAKIADGSVTSAKIADGSVTPAKMAEYLNSGLVKLEHGESKVLFDRGEFTLTAVCTDAGGGSTGAELKARNNGTEGILFESDYESNYSNPVLDPGEELNAFFPVNSADPYWFGDYYNMFSMTSADGSTSIYGGGNIGANVLDSDCVFQLFAWGS